MNVGAIIHRLRKERKLTLLELSNRSGVALATLSRMENGKMTGTLDSHIRICAALEVPLPDLYTDLVASQRKVDVQAGSARADIFVHDKRFTSEMLAPNASNKKMMPAMIRIAKLGSTHRDQAKPGVERFAYILDGKIEATIGDQKYNMSRGDTLYFDASAPHHFTNIGQGEAKMISVTCPPVL